MRIRITGLKETRECTRVTFIHDRICLLNSVDTVPLSLDQLPYKHLLPMIKKELT